MGEWRDFALPGGSYSDETRPWTQQDVCNYLPTFAEGEGTRSRLKLATAPGLRLRSVVGNGPHRGARDVEGKRFVVSGNKLYQLSTAGVPTELGTIPGTRRVSMTHNQISGGNQLVIATGDNTYVWDTVEETLTATGIPLVAVDFLNQLIVGVDVARRFWRYSALADATSWNSLDNESAESSPDRIVGLVVSQGELLIFGERTIEVWSNSPTDTTAFQRTEVIEKGCVNGNTIQRLDNTVFFVGDDFIPYRLNGYAPAPIASKAITAQLAQGDPTKLFSFTWEDRGYVCYYLTAQDGNTWGYDVTCQRWHRRESFGLARWRLNTLFKWNGSWWGGDYSNGKLYQVEWGLVYEDDAIFPRYVRSGVMHNDGNRVFIHALRLLANTGLPSAAPGATVSLAVTGDMPGGTVGDVVSGDYLASGGIPDYTFAVTSGALPGGITLGTDGAYYGNFGESGTFSWEVTVTDGAGNTATVADTATVAAGALIVGAEYQVNPAITTSVALNVPADAADGDLLILGLASVSSDRFTIPGGWTTIKTSNNEYLAYKIKAGDTTVTAAKTGGHRHAACLLAVRAAYVSNAQGASEDQVILTKATDTARVLGFVYDLSRTPDSTPPADFAQFSANVIGTWSKVGHTYCKNGSETTPQIQVFLCADPQPAGDVAMQFALGESNDGQVLVEVEPP